MSHHISFEDKIFTKNSTDSVDCQVSGKTDCTIYVYYYPVAWVKWINYKVTEFSLNRLQASALLKPTLSKLMNLLG